MPASKHMVILEKRRGMRRQALMPGRTYHPKPKARRLVVESRPREPGAGGEGLSLPRD